MYLIVEKYHPQFKCRRQPSVPEPVSVTFSRYNKEFLVSAIMEFLDYNFTMITPPKYRDSEGDMVLLDSKKAFEAAVDDLMRTTKKAFVVHVDGTYKYETMNEKQQSSDITSTGFSSTGCAICAEDGQLPDRLKQFITEEVEKQIVAHPVFDEVRKICAQRSSSEMLSDTENYKSNSSEMSSDTENDESNGSEMLSDTENDKSYGSEMLSDTENDKTHESENYFISTMSSPNNSVEYSSYDEASFLGCAQSSAEPYFSIIRQTPLFDFEASCRMNGSTVEEWKRQLFDNAIPGTVRNQYDLLLSKQWVIELHTTKDLNLTVVNRSITDGWKVHSTKFIVEDNTETSKIISFTVWLKCSMYAVQESALWQLAEITDDEFRLFGCPKFRVKLNEGQSLDPVFKESALDETQSSLDSESYSTNHESHECEEQKISYSRESDEYPSSESTASDFEVIVNVGKPFSGMRIGDSDKVQDTLEN